MSKMPLSWWLIGVYSLLSLGAAFPSREGYTTWAFNLFLVVCVRVAASNGR